MDKLLEALLLEIVATGQAEGIYYGPEWCQEYIESLIDANGGLEIWIEHLGKSWEGPIDS